MSELRVLVVDDQPDVVESLASIVKQWGHKAAVAYSGEQAIAVAEEFDPHVVLLDIMMPNMDGYAVAQQLRMTRHRNETTIIGVTALQADEHKYKSYDSGFDLYLVKPVNPEKLKKILEGFKRTLEVEEDAKSANSGISALVRKASRVKSEKTT